MNADQRTSAARLGPARPKLRIRSDGGCGLRSQPTKRDASTGNPLPTCARERSHGIDVFGDNAPVHNRLCFWARHGIGDIGAAHRQRRANNHSENQTHLTFPTATRW
jgi:hypothetical protein